MVGPKPRANQTRLFELQTVPGLERLAKEEALSLLGGNLQDNPREGRVSIRSDALLQSVNRLRSVLAANVVETFDIAGPNALLTPKNLSRVFDLIGPVLAMHPKDAFQTSRISAAGADSPVFKSLRRQIAGRFGLKDTIDDSHLLVSVRRSAYQPTGWDVLVRTAPRPLSARAWRVCDFPAALNACVANAMVRLAGLDAGDRFVNLACGSGTLLIERMELLAPKSALGIDNDSRTLECAGSNLKAAGHSETVTLLNSDATRTSLDSGSVNKIVADLPFGMLAGTDEDLGGLYDSILGEAARIAAPEASLVVITSNAKRFQPLLEHRTDLWRSARVVRLKVLFKSGFLTPKIYVLRRRGVG